jgi:hypothetical protein
MVDDDAHTLERSFCERPILLRGSYRLSSVFRHGEPGEARLTGIETGIGCHKPSRRDENLRREPTHARPDRVVHVMQQSMGMDEVERAELAGVHVQHVGDDERGACTKPSPGVLDIRLAHVEPHILDIREVVHDVTGTTSNVEHAIARPRSKIGGDDRALEGARANDPLVGAKQCRHRER